MQHIQRAGRIAHAVAALRHIANFGAAVLAIAAVLAFPPRVGAAATWTKSGTIPGAFVNQVAYNADGSVLYAGGIGKVYRSTDDGRRWTASALPAKFASSVVVGLATSPLDKNLVLAGTWDVSLSGTAGDAVFASHDGGVTWQAGNLPNQVSSFDSQYPYYPVWDPKTALTAYAATAGYDGIGGIYRTTDGGKHWSLVYFPGDTSKPFPLGPIAAAPTNPVSLYLAAGDSEYHNDHNGFIAKSTNGGQSLTFAAPLDTIGLPGYGQVLVAFAHDPKDPKTAYTLASGYNDGTLQNFEYLKFLWTPNSGANWAPRTTGLAQSGVASGLAVGPKSGAVLLPLCCGPHDELYQSSNQGKTWSKGGALLAATASLAGKPSAADTLVAGGQGGIRFSDNSGKNWTNRNGGLDQPNITAFVADPQATARLYVGTRSGVLRSNDGGKSFDAIDVGLSDRDVTALARDAAAAPHALYAAAKSGVFVSRNPTAATPQWTDITPPDAARHFGDYLLAVDEVTAGRLYVATNLHFASREIYRTDDYGRHWTTTAYHAKSGNDIPRALIADPKTPGTIYVAAEVASTVYKSTNAGATFVPVLHAEGLEFAWGQKNAFNPRTLYLQSVDPSTGQPLIYRSTDGGKSWDLDATVPGGSFDAQLTLLGLAADPGAATIYALVRTSKENFHGVFIYALGLFKSTNRGFSWTRAVDNLMTLCAPCGTGLNGSFTVPAVTRDPAIWASGNRLVFMAPLASTLFQQTLR